MELLKGLICLLLAIQWTTAHPTFSDSPEPNFSRLFGYIGGIVNEGIRLHYPQQQSEGGQFGEGPYGGGEEQSTGLPIVGASKYDIIDLKAGPKS
ncbi:uncharacterized protein LOC116801626 [Drosophila sechellia]|uniref:uncharacterized protein LOC116801626 n=1 Tax=Drosophila sechellia TaxID=7238 RepID=UPI0013DDF88D|nr:uncharacterized protein LOC116801626 [Drosophila sechellia]